LPDFPTSEYKEQGAAAPGSLALAFGPALVPATKKSRNSSWAKSEPMDCQAFAPSNCFEIICAQKATKDNCTEETARKHLKSLPGVGQRIFTKNVVDTKGGEGFAVKVEVVMVYRIYLTRSIKNRWEASRSERGGGGEAFSPSETQPANPVSTPGANNGDNEELKRRIDDLERQMAAMRNVNASVANAAYNRQSYFRGAFERPVAIGFRGIRVDFEKKARQ